MTPGPFEYLCQNIGVSENQFFLDEGAATPLRGLGVLDGQMARLYGGTIFGGGLRHLGALVGLQIQRFRF